MALLLGGPAILTALGLSAMETWRWMRPDSPLFAAPAAASLAAAIAADDVPGAYRFIRAGQDPNGVIVVRDAVLTRGRQIEVPPLIWAVAAESEGAVAMLLGFGARPDAVTRSQAICLAKQRGREDIVRLLELGERDLSPDPCAMATPPGDLVTDEPSRSTRR